MNVLHVIPGLTVGGAERLLLATVRALPHHQHRVLSLRGRGALDPALRAAGAALLHTRAGWGRGGVHVVQGWMYAGNVAAMACAAMVGAPVVQSIHSAAPDLPGLPNRTRALARLNARASHRARAVVYVADAARTAHLACGFAAHNAVHVPCGVDPAHFCPAPAARSTLRTALHLPIDTPLVALVARNDPLKDPGAFVAALATLPTAVHGVLAGPGLDTLPIAAPLRARVHALGVVADTAPLLAAVDACVLCSRSEATPMVLLEALACGTPCVATAVGDIPIILRGIGAVVPPGDIAALAAAIATTLATPPDPAALRQRVVDHYTQARWANALERTWSDEHGR